MKEYQIMRPIKRPVLLRMPWWQVDIQSLPPYGWCEQCGAEIYSPNEFLCSRCLKSEH